MENIIIIINDAAAVSCLEQPTLRKWTQTEIEDGMSRSVVRSLGRSSVVGCRLSVVGRRSSVQLDL